MRGDCFRHEQFSIQLAALSKYPRHRIDRVPMKHELGTGLTHFGGDNRASVQRGFELGKEPIGRFIVVSAAVQALFEELEAIHRPPAITPVPERPTKNGFVSNIFDNLPARIEYRLVEIIEELAEEHAVAD